MSNHELEAAVAQALALHQSGRLAEAEAIYGSVLNQAPHHAEVCQLLGALKLQTGRAAEAVAWLERAIAIGGPNAAVGNNLGSAYLAMSDYDRARQSLEMAIAADPRFAQAYYNLGLALSGLGRPDEAAHRYRQCIEREPTFAPAYNNLGDVLRQLTQFDQALKCCTRAVELNPGLASAHYNRALVLLGLGRLSEGWAEYEWRLRHPALPQRRFAQPAWDGRPLAGQTLLVHAEQGLGDTLQFVRLLPLVRERCPRVVVEVQPPLVPLLSQSGLAGIVPTGSASGYDVQIPLLSLPGILGIDLAHIPASIPYLAADEARQARWGQVLAAFPGRKVGIAWQGSPTYREDRNRSFPLAALAPLAAVPGVTLFSLQKGPGSEQIALVQPRFSVVDLGSTADPPPGAFLDTAAIMRHLDLVVTSDSALAHLAGGLGAPTWVALGRAPDWRWLLGRDDSPWYPTMRLFRQQQAGDWQTVFQRMAAELAASQLTE